MNNRISLKAMNLYYLGGVLIFLTLGNFLQALHFEFGLIFTEYVLVLGYGLLIVRLSGAKVSDYIHFGDVRRRDLLKTMGIALVSLPIVMTLNLITSYLLELFDMGLAYELPIAQNFLSVILQFFIISVSAGICEEVFFRGVIMNTYADYFSPSTAVLASALLFGLYHFNVENILGPIYLGAVFGYLAVQTGSIVPAILGHMMNNGVAYLLATMGSMVEVSEPPVAWGPSEILDTIWALLPGAIISFGIVLYLLRTFKKVDMRAAPVRAGQAKAIHFLPIAVSVVIYIAYTAFIFTR